MKAIPILLSVLDSDADIWKEAAMEALTHIALQHGETALEPIEYFILNGLEHDPFAARLYAYEPISVLHQSEGAKKFLIQMFELDWKWQGSIAHDLVDFGDKRILHMFRRAIEVARQYHDEFTERELREAYCILDGKKLFSAELPELWELPWQERWGNKLDELGKSKAEIEALDRVRFKPREDFNEQEWEEKTKAIIQERDNYPLCSFSLQVYIDIRERSSLEEDFQTALQFMGWEDAWSVERVQLLMNRLSSTTEALNVMKTSGYEFPSASAMNQFFALFAALWNETPRDEFHGLSPGEKRMLSEDPCLLQDRSGFSSPKIGRNEPCPCGSNMKYKKCHGK